MKHPTTRIEVRRSPGQTHLDVWLRRGALAPRLIDRERTRAVVALVSLVALLLAGDEVRLEVVVGEGVDLQIVETSGTVAYDMGGGAARWDVDLVLEAGARLTWLGLPFVVSGGACVRRSTHTQVGSGAVLLLGETLVLGRSGEVGGDLNQHTSVYAEGRPMLVEALDLSASVRGGFAVLDGRRCLDSLTVIGALWPTKIEGAPVTLLSLAGTGWIARSVVDEVHRSGIPELLSALGPPRNTDRRSGRA